MDLKKFYKEIKCSDAAEIFAELRKLSEAHFIYESKDISHIYGRLSLIGIDPVLEISAKNSCYKIRALNERADSYINQFEGLELEAEVKKELIGFSEDNRSKAKNTSKVIRKFLEKFKQNKKSFLGLYGAFAYDFARLFEDIPEKLEDSEKVDDFRLQLYDSFVFFDHLKEKAEIIAYREDKESADQQIEKIFSMFEAEKKTAYKIDSPKFEMERAEFEGLVKNAQDLAKKGELFEVVYSNKLEANFSGDPFALYQDYRDQNPSPYLFYFNFGNEQLVGASPEMMVRCEDGEVHTRPISGTAKRGDDPIEDHENMLKLLMSEKERSELDMLNDLGRNDLSRICEPGVKVSDYRFVEKYSKVMHTVAHVSGRLREGYTALDALIACANAGTLTGAPKVAAMRAIEAHEKNRRGYYGGAIGYLTFSGEMDTGIIIRTAHIKDGRLSFRVGATLLFDSKPEDEYEEIINKAQGFLTTIGHEV